MTELSDARTRAHTVTDDVVPGLRDAAVVPEATPAPAPEPAREPAPQALPAAARESSPRRLRPRFRRWRRTRPFWGSLILIVGGFLVAEPLLGAQWDFYVAVGARSLTPLLLGGGMIAAGLVSLFAPAQRHFPAIIAIMFAVASLPMANLGGWIIGMAAGIVGAGLVFAWTPYTDEEIARAEATAEAG